MLTLAIATSFVAVDLDERLQSSRINWLPPTGAECALMFSSIAGSLIGLANVRP